MSKRGSRNALIPAPVVGGPVHFRLIHDSGHQTTAEIGIDYSKAEVPDRSYYADYVDVQPARSGVSMLFGKLIPKTPRLRTQVEVGFPDDMFLRQIWGTSRDMHKTLDANRQKYRIDPVEEVKETDKVQTFRSNNAFMGMWGDESLIDFYYLSPRDLHYVKVGGRTRADLEPVVRIAMYSGLLLEFLDKCAELVPGLERAAREEMTV